MKKNGEAFIILVNVEQATELIETTQKLVNLDEKNYADSLWEIVASVNKQTIQKVREDENMCKALAEIMKPEIDEAFNNGFDNGFDNGTNNKGIQVFKNMIENGISKELAQKCAEISDSLVEKALSEM